MIKQIFVCDKCGKEEIVTINPRGNERVSITKTEDNKDLCDKCRTSLYAYIEKARKEWWTISENG